MKHKRELPNTFKLPGVITILSSATNKVSKSGKVINIGMTNERLKRTTAKAVKHEYLNVEFGK